MGSLYILLSIDVSGKVLIPNSRKIFFMCINFKGIWVQNFVWENKGLRNMFKKYVHLYMYNKWAHLLFYFSINYGVE